MSTHDGKPVYLFGGTLREITSNPIGQIDGAFLCVLFLYESAWNPDEMRSAISTLLGRGAVYFMFHGHDCQAAEDIADEVRSERSGGREASSNIVMTTSHKDEDVHDTVFFLLQSALPADDYLNNWKVYLVISLGNSGQTDALRALLAVPQQAIRAALNGSRP